MHTVHLSLVALSLSMLACGGSTPPPAAAQAGGDAPAAATGEPGAPSTTTDLQADAGAGTALPSTEGSKGEAGRRGEDIQAAIKARRDTARACYDEAQKRVPTLEGDITISWTIDPEGKVQDARVDPARSTIQDEQLGKCLVSFLGTFKFAASAQGKETRANYPFNFHPKTKQSALGY